MINESSLDAESQPSPEDDDDETRQWLTEIFRTLHAELLAYARRYVRDDEAEDVVDEAFLTAWVNRGHLPRNERAMRAWMYAAVRNHCLHAQRGFSRQRNLLERESENAATGPQATSIEKEVIGIEQLRSALGTLPSADREDLLKRAVGGYSIAELAEIAGCRPQAMRARLCRTRARLRTAMRDD